MSEDPPKRGDLAELMETWRRADQAMEPYRHLREALTPPECVAEMTSVWRRLDESLAEVDGAMRRIIRAQAANIAAQRGVTGGLRDLTRDLEDPPEDS